MPESNIPQCDTPIATVDDGCLDAPPPIAVDWRDESATISAPCGDGSRQVRPEHTQMKGSGWVRQLGEPAGS